MVYPLRPAELEANLRCSTSLLGPLPPSTLSANSHAAAAGSSAPSFGIYNMQLTYDAADHYLVLLGASGGPGALNGTQTWAFSNGTWRQLSPTASPESCMGSVLAYDEFDGYVLYLAAANFGSAGKCSSAGQTWIYHNGDWSRLTPSVSPPPRQSAGFTNDSRDGYMLLFGGACNMGVTWTLCGDTWKFLGGTWTNLTNSVHPSPRAGAGITYDASDGYVLLFGGTAWPVNIVWPLMVTDTWEYRAGTWTQIGSCGGPSQPSCGASAPPEPYDDGLAYDSSDGVVLYTSADNNVSSADPEIYWTYHARNWTDLNNWSIRNANGLPSNRLAEALAYDWGDRYAVLFGGISTTWRSLNDTWSFHGGNWTNINRGGSGILSVTASAAPDTGPAPLQVSLQANATGGTPPYQISWVLGDGGNGTGASVQHTYAKPGAYLAIINVWDSWGRFTNASVSVAVTAGGSGTGPLSLVFTASPNHGPAPLNVTFNVSAVGGSPLYSLTICTAQSRCSLEKTGWTGSTEHFLTNYSAPGNYSASATVTDSRGNQSTVTSLISVTSYVPVSVSANISARSGLSPLTVSFTANVRGGYPPFTIQWGFGDGSFGTSFNDVTVFHSYLNPGAYHPILAVTDGAGHHKDLTLAAVTVVSSGGWNPTALPEVPSLVQSGAVIVVTAALGIGACAGYLGLRQIDRRRLRLEGEAIVRSLRDRGLDPGQIDRLDP